MVVCRFWTKGFCREGDNCRFEHPPKGDFGQQNRQQGSSRNQNRYNNQNSVASLGTHNVSQPRGEHRQTNRGGGSAGTPQGGGRNQQNVPRDAHKYDLDPQRLVEDLGPERPEWLMSSYGPGRDPPVQLFGGFPLEQSPEEIRVLHYLNMASGAPQKSAQQEQELASQSNQHVQSAVSDPAGAIRYIMDGFKIHPNRRDQCGPRNTPGEFSRETRRREIRAVTQEQQRQAKVIGAGNPASFNSQQPQPTFGGFGSGFTLGSANQIMQQPRSSDLGFSNNGSISTNQSELAGVTSNPQNGFMTQQNQAAFPQSSGFTHVESRGGFGTDLQPVFNNMPPQVAAQGGAVATFGGSFPPAQTVDDLGQKGQMNGASSNSNSRGFPLDSSLRPMGEASSDLMKTHSTASSGNLMQPFNVSQQLSQPQSRAGGPPSILHTQESRVSHDGRLQLWKGHPVEYIDNQPCYRTHKGTIQKIFFPNGPPDVTQSDQSISNFGQEMTSVSSDLTSAFEIVRQAGAFSDGMMPETPPAPQMCRWDI